MSTASASLSPRATEIANVARSMIESVGLESLTMRTLAERLNMRTASLYTHFADRRALENGIIAVALQDQGERVRPGLAAEDPLTATCALYRQWAVEHPQTYLLMTSRGLDRTAPGVAEAEAAPTAVARSLMGGDQEASAILWAFCHGLLELELTGRFPPGFDFDVLWRRGLDAMRTLRP